MKEEIVTLGAGGQEFLALQTESQDLLRSQSDCRKWHFAL